MKTYDPEELCPKCSERLSRRRWIGRIGDDGGVLLAECPECGYQAERAPHDAFVKGLIDGERGEVLA